MNKIFQIGFNKCGTMSLFDYFCRNKINSVHWKYDENSYIAQIMYNNNKLKQNLLKGIDDRFVFFSDMEHFIQIDDKITMFHGYEYFEQLYTQYPNSKFIFNTRNIDDWIKSRKKHDNGIYLENWCKNYNLSENQIITMWEKHFLEHTEKVLNFFKDKQEDILIFKLGCSDHNNLYTFLSKETNINKNIKLKHIKT